MMLLCMSGCGAPDGRADAVDEQSVQEEQGEAMPESPAEEVQPETEPAPVQEGSIKAEDYAVIIGGQTIPLCGDMRDYTALLGEPDEYGSAKSCVEAGDDKVYTYGDTVIYTYITNGADIISIIEISGSDALLSGIHIGSTRAEVIAAYGSSYTEEGQELLYELGDRTIGLMMDGDSVVFMELFGQ